MSVDTYTDRLGCTVVRIRSGITDKIILRYEKRADALTLLKALRKRVK